MKLCVLDFRTGNVDIFACDDHEDPEEVITDRYDHSEIQWMNFKELKVLI